MYFINTHAVTSNDIRKIQYFNIMYSINKLQFSKYTDTVPAVTMTSNFLNNSSKL